ncbi:hypothetical protein BDM02DRAFT_3119791 [Thelephora ganbajun]|uniref:Uncharacterized protein n=1 Tax=Thelephora ganbajun TaxID=370292 RepID=A0ACB6Z8T2_THEGA|nr:hypothetical protein BDM02DRAFT_3119791 [Thelephora ganbajun]
MNLPPELLDEIIGHLPPEDKQSLRNCSLVVKSWIHPSRRRLFETVDVLREANLWAWLNNISPENIELFHHVRSLSCKIDASPRRWSDNCAYFLHNDFPLFPQLRNLVLRSGHLISITQLWVPLAFQHTLEYLSLRDCRTTIGTLITLINHFPNLVHLNLDGLFHEVDHQPIPPLSRPLRKLSVTEPNTYDDLGILGQLSELRPQCEEVVIMMDTYVTSSLTQRVIDGVETSVKRLRLRPPSNNLGDHLTLLGCRELRELEICLSSAENAETDLISSISSPNIQKIIFTQSHAFDERFVGDPSWPRLENSLCRLVDQLERKHRLEVEFHVYNMEGGNVDFETYLPKFREKGRVMVLDRTTKMVVYCSDRVKQSEEGGSIHGSNFWAQVS